MPVVVYDANVLYPSTLRDVLIRVGIARLVQPKWTDRILDEVFRNLRANRPDLAPARLDRTRRLMNDAIRDVAVTGYEHLIDQLDLPDTDDRHVLAAAIHAGAEVIVTRNLRDFPAEHLSAWEVQAQHPDDFLAGPHQDHPDALSGIVTAIARTWGDGATPSDVLDRPAVDTPQRRPRARCTQGPRIDTFRQGHYLHRMRRCCRTGPAAGQHSHPRVLSARTTAARLVRTGSGRDFGVLGLLRDPPSATPGDSLLDASANQQDQRDRPVEGQLDGVPRAQQHEDVKPAGAAGLDGGDAPVRSEEVRDREERRGDAPA